MVSSLNHVLRQAQDERGQTGYTVLVIDDDAMIRMSWELKKNMLGIAELYCFANLEEMQASNVDLNQIDIAFVDKNIEGSQYSGSETLTYLRKQGAKRIVLASGESAKTLQEDPQFKEADFFCQDKIPKSVKEYLIQ